MDGQQNQCNITDASPHLTTRLLHSDLYSDLESRFGPMQARKPAQDTLSHTGRMELCHFSVESQSLLQNYIDLMFERQTSSRIRPNIKISIQL